MPSNLPPQLKEAWTRVKLASAKAFADVRAVSQSAGGRIREVSKKLWSEGAIVAARGWISFRDSWTKQDWFAGIKPLPPGMAGHLAALAIVIGLVFTSLMNAEILERREEADRLYASREHPSQQEDLPAPVEPAQPGQPVAPVPEPATPGASPAPAAPSRPSQLPQIGEAFIEKFESADLHDRWFVSDGWSNGDWLDNDWRGSQTTSGNGSVKLTMEPGPADSKKPLASGEIRTLATFRYGYFEFRARVPRDPGLVSGLFTYADPAGAARSNEIDIEFVGKDTRRVELTIHENGKPTHQKVRLPFDAADGMHTYAFDWRPNSLRWYVDGEMVHEVVGGAAARLVHPQQIFLSLIGSRKLNGWLGPLDLKKGPWTLQVGCVAYAPDRPSKSLCE
ncbi:MAG: family 16 glycosylhydrolase [Hyphomonadaceae bacterium]